MGYSTPKKRSKSDITPRAPRKPPRQQFELPEGKRLEFSEAVSGSAENTSVNKLNTGPAVEIPVDYAGAMGVVGFISSYIARGGSRIVPLSQLVQIISSTSVAHKTATSALMAARNLAKAIPEWITVCNGDVYEFSSELRTFEVLQKLSERRRQQIMEETNDLRCSIAEMRKSLTSTH